MPANSALSFPLSAHPRGPTTHPPLTLLRHPVFNPPTTPSSTLPPSFLLDGQLSRYELTELRSFCGDRAPELCGLQTRERLRGAPLGPRRIRVPFDAFARRVDHRETVNVDTSIVCLPIYDLARACTETAARFLRASSTRGTNRVIKSGSVGVVTRHEL